MASVYTAIKYLVECVSSGKFYQKKVLVSNGCTEKTIVKSHYNLISELVKRIKANPNTNFPISIGNDIKVIIANLVFKNTNTFGITIRCKCNDNNEDYVEYIDCEKRLRTFLVGLFKFFVNI